MDPNYLEGMLKSAGRLLNLNFSEGFPHIPEIDMKHNQNLSTIFKSEYMSQIPVDDFATGAYNAMRFCFAYGVIMAAVWHLDFNSFHKVTFAVDTKEISTAIKALGCENDEYEAVVKAMMDNFMEILSDKDNPNPRVDLNSGLSAAQTVGTAVFLKKAGFK